MFHPVTIGNYKLIQFIGSGSFATVWLGEHIITGNKVAVKVICKSNMSSTQNLTRFRREINLLKQIDHPFIIQLFDVIEDDEAYYLIMEYAEKGSLFSKINNEGRLSENSARRYFCQLLSALNYLHNEKFIAHRDLKPENILIDKYDNIRLIDFGLSNYFSKSSPNLNTSCGSPAYAAPEMIQGKSYTKSADIWSAGVILYAMIAGKLPFDDPDVHVILQKVVYTNQIYPSIMSRSLIDLLERILSKDPKNRLTITQIANHPWLSQSEIASIIENKFYFTDTSSNIISSSISMPLLSVSHSSSPHINHTNTSNLQLNNSYEIQNSSSFDLLDSNSSFDINDINHNDQLNELNQSQNTIHLPNHLIDKVVAQHMVSMGINISSLDQDLLNNKFNDETAIYKQFKKAKTSCEIGFIMSNLNDSKIPLQFQPPFIQKSQTQKSNTFRRSSYPTHQSNQASLLNFYSRNVNLNNKPMNQKMFPHKNNLQLSMIIQA